MSARSQSAGAYQRKGVAVVSSMGGVNGKEIKFRGSPRQD